MAALGHDREAGGDALYGALTGALLTLKSSFATPQAAVGWLDGSNRQPHLFLMMNKK
jgi:hypothetical protein